MKNYLIIFFVSLQIFAVKVFSQQGEWTWMKGNNTLNSAGVFGAQGTPASGNTPPALYEACEWTDLQGNFWLFGGCRGVASLYSDLWKYSPATNEWVWVKGSSVQNQPGSYGTQGVSSINNIPGSRLNSATCVDDAGNLWLFGGLGLDETGAFGELCDLWKYDIATNEWTWIKGSKFIGQNGVYGTITVSNPANFPGSRNETNCLWAVNNTLWLFGGYVLLNDDRYNDLWRYDISSNEWTWMKGDNTPDAIVIYNTKGVADPTNDPGSRIVYTKWKDKDNNLWLFGGSGRDNFGIYDMLNDVWKYDIVTNMWTWISGTDIPNDIGNYGTKCIPSVNNIPPARYENRAYWSDNCGNLWLFGGYTDININFISNDLWHYNITTNEWAWVSGSNTPNQVSSFGTQTVSAPGNIPGSRGGAISWMDVNGNLWLFGGYLSNSYNLGNDLWRYVPDPNCPVSLDAGNDTNICDGGSAMLHATGGVNYSWSPAGSLDDPNSPDPVATPDTTTLYTVTSFDGYCTKTDSVQVAVFQYPQLLTNDTGICKGDIVTLQASGGTTYSWTPVNSLNNSSIANPVADPDTTTLYKVNFSNSVCSAVDSVLITVLQIPDVKVNNDTDICQGSSVNLVATGASNYLWNTGSSSSSITVSPQATSTYTVTGVGSDNCTDTDGVIVSVIDTPYVDLGTDTCIFTGEGLVLDAGSGYDNYLWQDGNVSEIYNVSEPDIYNVTVTNSCGDASDVITITECPSSSLWVPDVFTPNGDGKNDLFIPAGTNITDFEMYIFDRWGQLIFKTTDINKGWNGTFNNKTCQEGVYSWLIFYTGVNNTRNNKYGHVTLLW